jgi:two-component system LytT family response regulator
MTLATAAGLLGPGFAKVHRSRLVNLSLVRAERPQPSGDVQLLLADGSRVMASRRFRDRLPSARADRP